MTLDEHAHILTERALEVAPLADLADLAAQLHDGAPEGPAPSKYLDARRWLAVCARRAVAIGLHEGPPRRVLDLGTGAAYFPFVARLLGHEVVATDWSKRDALYREVTRTLGVEVMDLDVTPFVPLASACESAIGTFDAITAYMVTFNGHRIAPWGVREWHFFIENALAQMRIGSVLCLELNAEPDGSCYSKELKSLFLEYGAITGHWPHEQAGNGHRVVIRKG